MKKLSSQHKRQFQVINANSKCLNNNIRNAIISEGDKWWFCYGQFDKQGKCYTQPINEVDTTGMKFISQKGATPIKAVRNLLKILPRRI